MSDALLHIQSCCQAFPRPDGEDLLVLNDINIEERYKCKYTNTYTTLYLQYKSTTIVSTVYQPNFTIIISTD